MAPSANDGAANAADLAARIASGDIRAIARAITHAEERAFSGVPDELLAILRRSPGHARLIGVTGPPGAGKSTLVDKLVAKYREAGLKVAVVAVDPSSPFSGGAILGDRIRMQRHATDTGVFIRSLASRGHLGGVSRATGDAVTILDAAGYDRVIIETVGVGQSEVEIVKLADMVVLVSVPGLGDDIQVIKAGIMEIGDVFVVNKSDREGADRVVREIRMMVETGMFAGTGKHPAGNFVSGDQHEAISAGHAATNSGAHHIVKATQSMEDLHAGLPPLPAILKTIAETGEGVPEAVAAIEAFWEESERSGELARRRRARAREQLRQAALWHFESVMNEQAGDEVSRLADDIAARKTDPRMAAEQLAKLLIKRG